MAIAITTTRRVMPERAAKIFLLFETLGSFPLRIKKAPSMVASSARAFINPLKGSRKDMTAKDTKHVAEPGIKPKKR